MLQERKKKENVIIVGLNESEMNTTMLMSFFEEKLNISPPPITYTKRLGRKNKDSVYPPLLVDFKMLEDKKLVMKRKKFELVPGSI